MAIAGRTVAQPASPTVHGQFEQHVRDRPDALAVTCGDFRQTYAGLDAAAARVAATLVARGVRPGALVGVCVHRAPELMPAILGVLKAGAAYVPLDPTYPAERVRQMLDELPGMEIVLVTDATAALVTRPAVDAIDVTAVLADPEPAPPAPPVTVTGEDRCYVVFTSGSTGTPKAVGIRHVNWYNLLDWLRGEYRLDHRSDNLMISSFGFDISQRSLMAPLFTGATSHLLPSRTFDVRMAHRLIGELGVRTLHCAPSTLYLLVDYETANGREAMLALDYVFIGGERLSVPRVADWAARPGNTCLLLHQYGVAECTDIATSFPMHDVASLVSGALAAGTPVQNTEIVVVDEDLAEVPDGELGEICITGRGIGVGYLNSPEATTTVFRPVHRREGGTVEAYRTGDRGHIRPDGQLVVTGRIDHQVKVRGMRIDVGDVEHGVRQLPSVRDVAVVVRRAPDDATELIAVVVPVGELPASKELRRQMSRLLPANMVPAEFHGVDSFPLSPNGKIDRQALGRLVESNRPMPSGIAHGVPSPGVVHH